MMKIAILQRNIVWCDAAENRRRIEAALAECEPCDLCVLPEMFSTGFCPDPAAAAEPADGATAAWLKAMAQQHRCAMAGSIAVSEGGKYYNRFYFVPPEGDTVCYDKRHLFTYSGENDRYTAGQRRVVVEYAGARILLQVCYDLRFPVFSRNRRDYDIALYVACWPASRGEVWRTLLRARALENQCFVVGVNCVGQDGQGIVYDGDSVVLDAYGRTLAACESGREGVAYAAIDLSALERFRCKFPVLGDADDFSLE